MRFHRIDRFLLVLAALFVVAALRGRSLPGEEVLPDLYGTFIERPLLAGTVGKSESPAKEAARLRSEVASLEREVRELRTQVTETRKLGQYFDQLEWPRQPRAVPAWVTGIDPDPWQLTLRIGCGTENGVALAGNADHGPQKLAVVSGKALLGVVIRTHRRDSTVRRVDDDRFRLEVEIQNGTDVLRGIVSGQGGPLLALRFVRKVRGLKVGLPVLTSSYDADIPPGLLVGRIEAVSDEEGDGVREVAIQPAASFVRLGQVDVLVPRRGR